MIRSGAGFPLKRLDQGDRLFHQRPSCVPRGGVAGDAFRHFGVKRLRCRDQDGLAAGVFRECLRIAAFARPRAAEDEEALRHHCGVLQAAGRRAGPSRRHGCSLGRKRRALGAPWMLRQIADADRSYACERNRVVIFHRASADADRADQDTFFVNDGQSAGKRNQAVV